MVVCGEGDKGWYGMVVEVTVWVGGVVVTLHVQNLCYTILYIC